MARQKGSANLAATIEVLAGGALDARTTVPTEADLTIANNFPYPYVGLFTVVQATGDMWVLTAMDVTVASNWHKVGDGGSDNVVEGYYYDVDGKFYKENTHVTEIQGEADVLYISVDTNLLYRYDGSEFLVMSSEGIQVDTMPTADLDLVGTVYQYIGATDSNYTHGCFYECVNDSGVYSWQYLPTVKSDTVVLTQAQFDALPQAEKDNGTTYYISDSSSLSGVCVMGNRFDKANIYTDTERMVGSYMGKPLYQKTFGATVSAKYSLVSGVFMRGDYSLLSANLDIEDMPFVDGFYTDTTNNETASFIDVWYNTTDSKLYFITYLDREDVAAEFTIQYTKVHDGTVAIGAGNDYSTDEQIIGTWIDGKRLYRKCYDAGAYINNIDWDVSALHIDRLVNSEVLGADSDSSANPQWVISNVSANFDRLCYLDANNHIVTSGNFYKRYIIIEYTKTTD